MKRRFLSLFLSGKVAAVPALVQQAHALMPSFADAVSPNLSQIQVPTGTVTESKAVRLDSMGSATEPGQAYLCTNSSMVADQLSLVITGLKHGEAVFVVASKTQGSQQETALDPRLKVSLTDSEVLLGSVVAGPEQGHVSFSTTVDLSKLAGKGIGLTEGAKFYLQTVVFPPGSIGPTGIQWAMLRYSEVDTIVVGRCETSTYGSTY